MSAVLDLMLPEILTRADVRVDRRYGWVRRKDTGDLVGSVGRDTGAAGNPIWRAWCSDLSSWSDTRGGAILCVLAMWNMHEKARAYDWRVRLDAREAARTA